MRAELDALRQAGIEFTVDDKALDDRRLRIEFRCKANGVVVEGEALFPHAYPYFRPTVNARHLGLSHHQSPLGELGNLCLLGRAGDLWQPSYDLAWLLTHQLPSMLSSGKLGATREERAVEDVQAEPYSAYLPCAEDAGLILDSSWEIPSNVTWGRLVIGLPEPRLKGTAVRGAVLQVLDPDRNVLAEADASVASIFPHRAHGRWVRSELDDPRDPLRVVKEVKSVVPSNALQTWPGIPSSKGEIQILGVLFPEEVSHRHPGRGWYFVSFIRTTKGKGRRKTTNTRPANPPFLRPLYGGPKDLSLRVPELEPLRSKTVAVFGLGTLGAPAALEFGRAGVEHLRILDHDFVDTGPSVRWPFGLREAGRKKVDVIKEFLQQQYPYTSVHAEPFKIGDPPVCGRKTDQRVMEEMLIGTDLLFDATASLEVQKYLFDEARLRGIPYLSVVGRPGAWGGIVYRYRPGAGRGCWHCWQHAIVDGVIPDAPSDSGKGVQARGCGDVTFTGTSFDMGTIALDAVRRAVATLCHNESGYPDQDWDVAVIALRNDDGSPCAPTWSLHKLPPREGCECSGASA